MPLLGYPSTTPSPRAKSLLWLVLCVGIPPAGVASARPVADSDPYDTFVMKGDVEFDVFALDLPQRRNFSRPTTGTVNARLFDQPGVELSIEWSFVKEFLLYEERLSAAAAEAIRDKDYDLAYRLLARLEQVDRGWPGLDRAFQQLMRDEALASFRSEDNAHALALLGALYSRAPDSRGLDRAVDAVGNAILEDLWANDDFEGLRTTYKYLNEQFDTLDLQASKKWAARLASRQQELLRRATAAMADDDLLGARRYILAAEALQPLDAAGRRVLDQIRSADPAIRIGVFRPAPSETLRRRMDRPATLRVGRLRGDALVWLDDYQSSGGRYGSPLGRVQASDDRRRITLTFRPEVMAIQPDIAHELTRVLLAAAVDESPEFGPLMQLIETVGVEKPNELVVTLRLPHLRPEALLLGALPPALEGAAPSPWERQPDSSDTVFARQEASGTGMQLQEITFTDDQDAIIDITRGFIDVLADVPPWRVATLQASQRVEVGQYRMPTVHCLLVGKNSRLALSREGRRAIAYATPRSYIVSDLLLSGRSKAGYQVLSGPLPAGVALSDPLRYAYSTSIAARPFRPRLAALLSAVSIRMTAETVAEGEPSPGEPAPEPPPLTLAHPTTPVATLASQTIGDKFAAMGIPLQLVPIADEAQLTTNEDFDLRYVELRIDEPMVQAWSLLGPGGLACDCSEALLLALERVPLATTGQELSDRLSDVHQVAHGDLQVIPLFQTVNHYAWHKGIEGLPRETVDLYQTVDQWRRPGAGGAP